VIRNNLGSFFSQFTLFGLDNAKAPKFNNIKFNMDASGTAANKTYFNLVNNSNLSLSNCSFESENSSLDIYCTRSNVELENVTVFNNSSSFIYTYGVGTLIRSENFTSDGNVSNLTPNTISSKGISFE
jgi:hypothetical protein